MVLSLNILTESHSLHRQTDFATDHGKCPDEGREIRSKYTKTKTQFLYR